MKDEIGGHRGMGDVTPDAGDAHVGSGQPGEESVHVRGAHFFRGLGHAAFSARVGVAYGKIVEAGVGRCRRADATEASASIVLTAAQDDIGDGCSFRLIELSISQP